MTRNTHDQARQLIAFGPDVSDAQQSWLRSHLDECEACRDYAEAANRVARTMRSLPIAADSRLVRATQMRVRFHASRLRATRERMWLVGMACLGVGLSTTLTAPLLWQLFRWMAEWLGVPPLVWQSGFVFFFITPTVVVVVLLLAGGTRLTENRENQWR